MNVLRKWHQERFLRTLARRSTDDLVAITLAATGWRRALAIRALGIRSEGGFRPELIQLLGDSVPAVRRHTAWAMGNSCKRELGPRLLACAREERVDMVRFSMAAAAIRCGGDPHDVAAVVMNAAQRSMVGAYGRRVTGGSAGFDLDTCGGLWRQPCVQGTLEFSDARERAREVLGFDADNREAVIALGLSADPRDYALLSGMWMAAGRRMRLSLVMAMGLHGDPRWLGPLLRILGSLDVDPGHGFALRAEAATALGRLGLYGAVQPLVVALTNEAMDHEGRPGAGLGIQRSVRSNILGALGELGGPESVFLDYLGNTHGNATGGFYLPAMDGLWKRGCCVSVARLLKGEAVAAANALGVLGAIKGAAGVFPWRDDPRPLVRGVAMAYSPDEVIDEP